MARLFSLPLCVLLLIISVVALGQTTFIVSSIADAGTGSLRAAITSANVQPPSAVIIDFDPTFFNIQQTITLESALPAITKSDVTITGPGAGLVTISGNNAVRVFLINSGVANVAMSGLTIANGQSSGSNSGGCIINNGQLSLTGCVISKCMASGPRASGGGGIYNDGTLVVDQCTFSGNMAAVCGGAIFSEASTSLTVSRSTFTANTADSGSGGDAIFTNIQSVATISDSTFYNNGKSDRGNAAFTSRGTTSFQRCTIFANYGNAGNPGGLHIGGGTATIDNSIIYGNLAVADIRANGQVVDNGYNIIGTAQDFTPASTTLSSNPLLADLADNGGPTWTCALLPGSPAINAGNPDGSPTIDQRGRPQAFRKDIGAFEVQFADVSLTQTALPSLPAGSLLIYTITITNNGPFVADNVVLTDTLPAGVTFDSVTPLSEMQFSMTGGVVTGMRESMVAGTSITIYITVKVSSSATGKTISNIASVTTTSVDVDPSNDHDTADTVITNTGTGGGDPSFMGFMGQKFGFSGKANKSFHIFSDPYITINSRFAVANLSKGKGTVMHAFGIRWENHTVTFGVDSMIKNNGGGNKDSSLLISIDGIKNTLPRSNQVTQLDDCINATWSFPKLRINTPLHKIVIDWRSEHNAHINGSYLNIRIDAPLDNPTLLGGVLGQTASAKNVKSISKKDSDFITSDDMISTEAKTSKFTAHPMLCAAIATQPPSTAEAAHEHDEDITTDVHVAHGMRV